MIHVTIDWGLSQGEALPGSHIGLGGWRDLWLCARQELGVVAVSGSPAPPAPSGPL